MHVRLNPLKAVMLPLTLWLASCSSMNNSNEMKARPELAAKDLARLEQVLSSQPEETKARYSARHPKETIEFFGVKPGDTVVEVMPGYFWYSSILAPYLGREGKLIGIDYDMKMWPMFGIFPPEFIASRKEWHTAWYGASKQWGTDIAEMVGYEFATVPVEQIAGSVDSVLFIRALHNLARFEEKGGFLTDAVDKSYQMLKPGGYVGVVQHAVDESYSDDYASGRNGYMKKSKVIEVFTNAGFQLVAQSDINANPKDRPEITENVWRLPPSSRAKNEDGSVPKKYLDIGESNRMTLLFRKPKN